LRSAIQHAERGWFQLNYTLYIFSKKLLPFQHQKSFDFCKINFFMGDETKSVQNYNIGLAIFVFFLESSRYYEDVEPSFKVWQDVFYFFD